MKDWQEDENSVAAETTTLLTDFHPPTSGYPFAGCTSAEPASVLPDSDSIPNQRLP
jgi:hypothetical protein